MAKKYHFKGMELKRITVLSLDGEKLRTWALTDGYLAIHKTPVENGQYLDRWTVTHVATGCAFFGESRDLDRNQITKVLARARSLEWQGLSVARMPACEMGTLLPKIVEDEKGQIDYRGKEPYIQNARETAQLIQKAHGC